VDLVTKPLGAQTWPDFARLVEDHHGGGPGAGAQHHWVVSRFVGERL